MPASVPTLRRRRLGVALRTLREEAGLNREEVAENLDCSASKIATIEGGMVTVRRNDLRDMLDLFGVTDADRRDELFQLAKQAKERGAWWRRYGDLPNSYLRLIELESAASSIRWFEPMVVPGLLQTEHYARAIIRATGPTHGPDEVEREVQARMTRQELLTRDDPPEVWVILDEAALRRQVGGRAVMREQCDRLVEVGQLPHVTLQVVPYTQGGYEAIFGGFALLRFPDPDPDIVYLEAFAGNGFLERPDEVRRCSLVFDHVNAVALSPHDSTELIAAVAKAWA